LNSASHAVCDRRGGGVVGCGDAGGLRPLSLQSRVNLDGDFQACAFAATYFDGTPATPHGLTGRSTA